MSKKNSKGKQGKYLKNFINLEIYYYNFINL